MDVLALHQAGIANAVASCGTSLTRHQAKILQRYASKVLFIYDADPAGRKSMMGGIDVLVAEGITPFVVTLPPGDDPDSFVRREGTDTFLRYAGENRVAFMDFQIRFFSSSGSFEEPDSKARSIGTLARTISLIPDRIRRELYLQELSEKLSVSREALQELTQKETRQNRFRQTDASSRPGIPDENRPACIPVSVLEKTFLKALLESTMYGNAVLEFAASHEEMLELKHPAAQEILSHMIRRYRQSGSSPDEHIDASTEISMFGTPEARDLASGLLIDQPVSSRWQEQPDAERDHARRCLTAFLDAFRNIILEPLRQRKQTVTDTLRRENDNSKAVALQKEVIDLNAAIRKTSEDLGTMIDEILETR